MFKINKKKKLAAKSRQQKILPQDPHPEVADQTNFSQQQACVFQPIIRTLNFHGGPSKPNCHVGWKKNMDGIIPIRFFYLNVAQTLLSQLFLWDPWILNSNGCKTFDQHLFIQKHPRCPPGFYCFQYPSNHLLKWTESLNLYSIPFCWFRQERIP